MNNTGKKRAKRTIFVETIKHAREKQNQKNRRQSRVSNIRKKEQGQQW